MDHAEIHNNPGNFVCDKNAIVELVVFVSANAGRPVSPVTVMLIIREAGPGISGGSVTSVLASTGLTGAPGLRPAQRPL